MLTVASVMRQHTNTGRKDSSINLIMILYLNDLTFL